MNKSALKKFATEARKELLDRVKLQARKIGITEELIQKANIESSDTIYIDEERLLGVERRQRDRLIKRIEEIGFERVMEETAYTWFNRFIALRFMEVNDYLPTKVRVLSSYNAESAEPDMMKEALSLDLELDKQKIYDLKMANNTDELFKYLIKVHCNDLNRYMPFMFETIEDYKEILFPEGLLGTDSFVRQMTDTQFIPESDWESVEIVGWLYQYYISEENERVIKAKKRYKAEELPFATQLFTPEWIVRYMVQNALGRYWIESHPEHKDLIDNWEFYLENSNPDEQLEEKLAPYINKEMNVEDIKCFDPAMGSGHILVYMFDVLFEIYSKCGYIEREIPRLIIENNLYGLDIDDRAYQLASFSVIMKALKYNKRFLREIKRNDLKMNLTAIQETKNILKENPDEIVTFLAGEELGNVFNHIDEFIKDFKDAKSIGSLLKLKNYDFNLLEKRVKDIEDDEGNLFELEMKERVLDLFKSLIKQARILTNKYDVYITNPPYAGNRYITEEVANYLDYYYKDVNSDLFAAFISSSFERTKFNGQMGFMTPFVWMFIVSYQKLRKEIIKDKTISSLIQLEYSGFDGATVPICTFTLKNYNNNLVGEYIKLSDFPGVANQPLKTLEAVRDVGTSYRYTKNQNNFNKIPGTPIAYWASEDILNAFQNGSNMEEIIDPKVGLQTGDNNLFLRFWWEVDFSEIKFDISSLEEAKISDFKWVPYNKGGERRQWYGNYDYVLNWKNNGEEIRNFRNEKGKLRSVIRSPQYYFKESITWSDVTSGGFSIRYRQKGSIHDVSGMSAFTDDVKVMKYLLGLMATKISNYIFKMLNPTIHLQIGDFSNFPVLYDEKIVKKVVEIVDHNLEISKKEWDYYENSHNFKLHPFILYKQSTVKETFLEWEKETLKNFEKLKENEENLNKIFINLYTLENELSPHIEDEFVTMRRADLEREVKSFLSYLIGCILGRYSFVEGASAILINENNILPLSGDYFDDNIVANLIKLVEIIFGKEQIEENLDFIANAIGRKKTETARETIRRYFLNDFYKDHVQTYKKRPIYWLFTSGKEKAFNCLIYMHRYDKTTLSRIRTEYLHEVQIRMDAEKKELLAIISGDYTQKEITAAKKELKALDKKIDELKAYDEKLHHMADMQIEIDLDDGVKHNYELFKGLVAKI